MAVTFAVLCDSEPEAAAELRRLCEQMGLEPVGPPHRIVGRAKWLARAAPIPERDVPPVSR
jgi:hypothetical protein